MADHPLTAMERSEEGGRLAAIAARERRWSNSPVEHQPSVDADYPPAALVMADVKLTRDEWTMVLAGLEQRADSWDQLDRDAEPDEPPTRGLVYWNLARRIRAAIR